MKKILSAFRYWRLGELRLLLACLMMPLLLACKPESATKTASASACGNGAFNYPQCDEFQSCGSFAHGQSQSRVMYQESSVPYNEFCRSEIQRQTCNNGVWGEWSGSYTFASCAVTPGLNCGSTLHGTSQSRKRYRTASVAYGSSCQAETQTRTCTNGSFSTWTGTYTYDTCTVAAPINCGSTLHGQTETRKRYRNSAEAYGSSCQAETQTRTCTNGTLSNWTGTYTYDTCTVAAPLNCGSTLHGQTETRKMYKNAAEPYGASCRAETQTRTCTDGIFSTWTGTYTYDTCTVAAPLNCGSILHGQSETRTKYNAPTVPFGWVCGAETQTRTCTNGTLSNWTGTYTYDACTVTPPLNCGSTPHNTYELRTAYLLPVVKYPGVCESGQQSRLCFNGVLQAWSGTHNYENCKAGSADDVDGDGIPNQGDNCVNHFNPTQIDSDRNGLGNVCDRKYLRKILSY